MIEINKVSDPVMRHVELIRINPRAAYNRMKADQEKLIKLQVENKRMKKALQAWIGANEGAPNKYFWAKEALEGNV